MTAQEFLQGYQTQKSRLERNRRRLDELTELTAIGYGERVQSGLTANKTAEAVEKLDAVTAEIVNSMTQAAEKMAEIIRIIDELQDAKQAEVLDRRYIEGQAWEQLAEEMGYTQRHIYDIHNKALQELGRILKKVLESA